MHADACLVQRVDQEAEVVRVAEARGRREVRGDLVAPGAAERVLHHRHQLDVGEAHLVDIGNELVGELAVRLALAPGAEVHLVDAHRLGVGLRGGAPARATPRRFHSYDDSCTTDAFAGGVSARFAIGSAFCRQTPSRPQMSNLYRVPGPTPGTNSSQTPDEPSRAHRVRAAVPEVEVSGQPDALGVRGPDGERRTGDGAGRAVVPADVGAEHGPQLLVPALADQVQVHLAERRQVAVRVVQLDRGSVGVGRPRGGSPAPCRRSRTPTQTPSNS